VSESEQISALIETVLVVDDEVVARMVISDYLRECGYRVVEAADTNEALAILKHAESRVSVILCGISQADAAGNFALAQWVRHKEPGANIILAGGHARKAEAAAELCESGPLLKKPYESHLVLDRIRQLLALRASTRKK
jgi:CheY-like chemotaxis protein